ncbi:carboxypeptidase-like regulatory domain-containing protein [Blastopirellula marina]|uniref:Carboxypeptidase regulatory-like domain-containing protein n=1 Tax=Blastopirellula marina TaxID=124 RepID=A0A2S8GP47_9BACT|nr:carboxypeptidase-like regulatory domain-containing protein [Blastopirellula marina]PQO46199.1 hypothetical protein C5Y93_09430 [Blastopirellula marina]
MNTPIVSFKAALTLAIMTVAVVGCSKSEDKWTQGRPPVYPASGYILLDGKPVEKATVTFQPDDPEGRGGYATTDSNGYFEAQTYEPGDGLTAGKHLVAIQKTAFVDKAGNIVEEIREPGSAIEKSFLPKKYASFEKSEIEVEIKADGENDLGEIKLSE